MKAVILAGGFGTRLAEETHLKPKPMVEIGGKPILWHIMKSYSYYGINDFIICCGYKGYVIKEYFANYFLHMSDVTFHFGDSNRVELHSQKVEPWSVTLVDTGENSMTGGRLGRVKDYLDDGPFCFTYGDGVADVDIASSIHFHKTQKKLATLVAVQPPGRYGALDISDALVNQFQEKPCGDHSWINGGYFILEPDVFDLIAGDACSWETDVLPSLQQIANFLHIYIMVFGNLWIRFATKGNLRSCGLLVTLHGSNGKN